MYLLLAGRCKTNVYNDDIVKAVLFHCYYLWSIKSDTLADDTLTVTIVISAIWAELGYANTVISYTKYVCVNRTEHT